MTDRSHRRKLARADFHTHEVYAALTRWASDGYRAFEEPNSEGRFVLFAEQLKPLPDELTLVIGDALHCQRSSLDHLIFGLSKHHSPQMTVKDEKDPAFPIGDQAISLADERIKHLRVDAQKDVCALAPDPARQPLDQDPLWLLNKVENRDKHREIPIAVSSAAINEFGLLASDGSDYFHIIGPQRLEMGAAPVPLMEFARSPGVKAKVGYTVKVVFDQGTEVADREVVSTLRWFHDHIQNTVFQRLEGHF